VKKNKNGDFPFINLYKTEMMPGEEEEIPSHEEFSHI
jgi:hypothetical protein